MLPSAQHPIVGVAPPLLEQSQIPLKILEGPFAIIAAILEVREQGDYPRSPQLEYDSMRDHWSKRRSEAPADRDSEIEQRFKKLNQQIKAIRNLSLASNNNKLLFDDGIMQAPLPQHLKVPQLERYDGTLIPMTT